MVFPLVLQFTELLLKSGALLIFILCMTLISLSRILWDLLFILSVLKLYDMLWRESLKIHCAWNFIVHRLFSLEVCIFWFWEVFLNFLYLLSIFWTAINWMWTFWLLFSPLTFVYFPALLIYNWHSLGLFYLLTLYWGFFFFFFFFNGSYIFLFSGALVFYCGFLFLFYGCN